MYNSTMLSFLKKYVKRFVRNIVVLLQSIRELKFSQTISTVDDILNNKTITNVVLNTIIDAIEVDSDSNVEVRLKLLNEIGSTLTVITNFNDINYKCDQKIHPFCHTLILFIF